MDQKKHAILIVDDEKNFHEYGEQVLGADYTYVHAYSGMEALKQIESIPLNAILLDVNLNDPDGLNGMELLSRIQETESSAPILLITGERRELRLAVKAIKEGAYDYLDKHHDIDRLPIAVKNAIEMGLREKTTRSLLREKKAEYAMTGECPALKETRRKIERIAPTDVPILIRGESGTGKELVAGSVHYYSHRTAGQFVKVSMADFPENLVESELFGYKKGAFTNALADKDGFFHVAEGGTIFLDEIGLAPKPVQAKILRVLDNGEFNRVGDTKVQNADVRVIAATNKDLTAEIQKENFLPDLYYRLNGYTFELPPLKERGDDVLLLAERFLRQACLEYKREPMRVSDQAKRILLDYEWPGNVRTLRNVMNRIVIFSDSTLISAEDVAEHIDYEESIPAVSGTFKEAKRSWERDYITKTLAAADGNKTKAAELLGVHRVYLIQLMKRLRMDNP
jgi:two-component system nitrogen regulation response regulator NtrX